MVFFQPIRSGPFESYEEVTFPIRGGSGGHVGERIVQKDPLEAELWPFVMSILFIEAKRAFF